MPYTPAQHRLFEFVAHDPQKAHAEGLRISQGDASHMAGEGIKPNGRHLAHALHRRMAYGAGDISGGDAAAGGGSGGGGGA